MSDSTARRAAMRGRSAASIALAAIATLLAVELIGSPEALAQPSAPSVPSIPNPQSEAAAAELPAELVSAVQRDLGLDAAEFAERSAFATAAVDVVAALDAELDITGAALEGDRLVVAVSDPGDVAAVEATGATAIIGELPQPDLSGETFYASNDLRGGLPYYFPGPSGETFRCSVGFSGVNASTNARLFITAGHCDGNLAGTRAIMSALAPGSFRNPPFVNIGEPVDGSHVAGGNGDSGGWDHGLVQVNRSGWTSRPEVVTWGGGQGAPLASAPLVVRDATPAIVGAPVCKSGSSSGWTCGTILSVDQTVIVGDPATDDAYRVNGIVASICILPGDSGGAAVMGTTAIGVNSASNSRTRCTSDSLGVFAPLYSTRGASANSLYGAGFEPSVGIVTPAVAAPTGSGRYTAGVVRGTLQHGGPRHRVEVVINGGQTRSATVASDGRWQVSTADIPRGVHTFSVRARWGVRSVSPARTGSWWNFDSVRRAGSDRFDTAVQISRSAFPSRAPVVVIANGLSFPDALSAGPAAVELGGPLLLVAPNAIPDSVRAELQRLQPERIVVVGGTGVVSASVARQLRSFASTGQVTRLGGQNRYETSRAIADFAFDDASEAYVATGASFADALSAGAAGANRGAPVVLVPGNASSVDSATRSLLSRLGVNRIYVTGGSAVVSSGIATSLRSVAPVTRLSGSDRYATSLAINRQAFRGDAAEAIVTNGLNFPDALAGSALAGVRGAPMYIVPGTCVPSGMVSHMRELGIGRVTLLGGSSVVAGAVGQLRPCS